MRSALIAIGLAGAVGVFGLLACTGGPGSPVDLGGEQSQGSSTEGASGGNGGGGTTTPPTTPPASKDITATIISASLGDDCGGQAKQAPSEDCASLVGGCGSTCQQSNVQIQFKSSGNAATKISIKSIEVLDVKTNASVGKLSSRSPKSWNGNAYVAWDESVPASGEVKASYDISAPSYANGKADFSTQYKLKITIDAGGSEIVVESVAITREPPVVT